MSPPTSRADLQACLDSLTDQQLDAFEQANHDQKRQILSKVWARLCQKGHEYQDSSYSSPTGSDQSSDWNISPISESKESRGKGSYVCLHAECKGRKFVRLGDLQRHDQRLHDPEPPLYDCPVAGCNRTGSNGLPRPDKLYDHMREKHKIDLPKAQKGQPKGNKLPHYAQYRAW